MKVHMLIMLPTIVVGVLAVFAAWWVDAEERVTMTPEDMERVTMTPVDILEADCSEPLEAVVARAERRVYARHTGRVEFNVTFHQGDKELLRVNAAGFVVDGHALVNAEVFRVKAVSSGPMETYIREAQSDVPIGGSVLKPAGVLRWGDEVTIGRGGIRVGGNS